MTKEQISFRACRRGWVTSLESALMGGVLALSQRAGKKNGTHWIVFMKGVAA